MKKLFSILLSLFTLAASAREPYRATVTVDSASATVSAPNLVDLSRDLKTTSLEVLLPIYSPVSPVSIDINLRGIEAQAAFAAGSTILVVAIPQTGDVETFSGATRDESVQLFKEFIRDGGRKHNLLKAYARYSPIDPIAGNPNSLMAQMAQADYLLGHLSPLAGCDCSWCAQPLVHQFQAGSILGRAFSKGFDTTVVTLPLRYSYSPNGEWAFILDAPVTYLRNGGASSIVSSFGFGFRIPITCDWSLTPIVRGGAGGSLDLCTAGSFISTGVTSVFNLKWREFVFSLTDYAGYISSTNLWLTGINFNYHLHNWIFKNGFSLTSCEGVTFCNRPLNFSFSFIDSCFTQDRLFIEHYDEVGVSLIATNINPCLDYDCLALGFSYQWGEKSYKGYLLNLVYQF